jgi:hypothetical protein
MTKATSARLPVVLPMLLGCLLLAAGPAFAQSATSTFTTTTSGTVGTPAPAPAPAPAPGDARPPPITPKGPEAISCSGAVKIATVATSDPTLPPGVVVTVDLRGLSCLGQSSGAKYINSALLNITRLLVANDVVQHTFAIYTTAAGGHMNARTAMVTLNMGYDTTSGALKTASASIGNFQ